MDKLIEVLLIGCLIGYLIWGLAILKRGGSQLTRKIKSIFYGWWQFVQRDRLTKKIMGWTVMVIPVLAFITHSDSGIIHAFIKSMTIAIGLIGIWILFDWFIYGLIGIVSVYNEMLTKLFFYLFASMIVVGLALYQGVEELVTWKIIVIGLVLISTYITNFVIMVRVMSLIKQKKINVGSGWKVVVLIIVLFIIILTLAHYFASLVIPNGFSQENLTIFDLFYYTVISFSTIGYGDISPSSTLTRGISIVATITSVMCLVILVNSMMSVDSKEE